MKALSKLAKGAMSPKLEKLFKAHLAETKGQVTRLKQVFAQLGEKPTGQHCNGIQGVIEEGNEALKRTKKAHRLTQGLDLLA